MTHARNPALEAAIEAAPEDESRWLVYADWLQAQGDPRGELISLYAKGLESEAQRHIARASDHFLGPLVSATAAVYWHLGFWDSVRLGGDGDGYDEAVLETLFSHPSARFLRGFTAAMPSYDGDAEYQPTIDALAALAPRPLLRELFLGDFEYPDENEISWMQVGSVAALWRVFPRLASLTLQGASIGLGEIDAPALETLVLRTGGLPAEPLRAIGAAKLPALRRLEVWTGSEGYGAESSLDDLTPILRGEGLPALVHLGLRNSEYSDDIAAALAGSGVLARLETLDLSMGTLGEDGAAALLADAAAFAHLKRIDLSENCLSEALCERLATLCPDVVLSDQKGEDERYASVGE